jgi:hypothetical protein
MKSDLRAARPPLRKVKALAAQQSRPLRELVAKAIGEKLEGALGVVKADEGRRAEPFFRCLDGIR